MLSLLPVEGLNMRLFVAISLPDEIQEMISHLYCQFHGTRWTPPERLHITLAFLGEVKNKKLPLVHQQLESISFEPFILNCDHFGTFKSGDIWLSAEPEEPLIALHNNITRQLGEIGIEQHSRPFKAHITLAYTTKSEEHLVLNLLESRRVFESLSFEVDHFNLVSSVLKPTGAIHKIEVSYPAS